MKSYWVIAFLILLYLIISTFLLQKVNVTSKTIIDELFHLQQGLAYCNYDFYKWDPKITTLPGLYLVSTLLCAPLGKCGISCLRFTNVVAGGINFLLFILLRRVLHPKELIYKNVLIATNLAVLPPLFFFNHVYYTDVLSITTVMSLLYFGLSGRYFMASLFGCLSFVVRQTNIIYVVFILGMRLLGYIYNVSAKKKTDDLKVSKQELLRLIKLLTTSPKNIFRNKQNINKLVLELCSYSSVLLIFLTFILLNGSIVVGDKEAHTAVLHFPQFFYFSIFFAAFSWPHFFSYIKEFINVTIRYFYISLPTLLGVVIIVQNNTNIHPYLLADNRHYMFYVWRYFFNSPEKRILWCPMYLFSCYVMLRTAYNSTDVRFVAGFIPTLILVLCFQGLIELRYFFIPFILLKLFMKTSTYTVLITELIFYLVINVATLNVFFTKEIYWVDFKDTQRLIW